jgi:Trk K+ transport system NAD-binding subunit
MSSKPANNTSFAATAIAALFAVTTIVFGIYGFYSIYTVKPGIAHNELTKWADVIYSTLRLFSMESAPENDGNSAYWAVSVARAFATITVFYSIALATLIGFKGWFDKNIYIRFYRSHYIVIGLDKESRILISDLIQRREKVIVFDTSSDKQNPIPGCVLINAANFNTEHLVKAGLYHAKALICMLPTDIENFNVLGDLINSTHKPQIRFILKIENPISLKMFEPQAFYSIENIKKKSPGLLLTVFNPNEFVTFELFNKLTLGSHCNTFDDKQDPVSILLMGLGGVGRCLLREVLLMAHFGNNIKSNIYIYTEAKEEIGQFQRENPEVLKNCNGSGLDLWNITFIQDKEKISALKPIHHVISCYEDEQKSIEEILFAFDVFAQMAENNPPVRTFHYYSPSNFDMHHEQISSFGALKNSMNIQTILDGFDEDLARRSHEEYARQKIKAPAHITSAELDLQLEQHDNQTTNSAQWLRWVNQPLFKRRANFTEKRHYKIKLLNLAGMVDRSVYQGEYAKEDFPLQAYPYLSEFTELNRALIVNWLNDISTKLGITHEMLAQRIDGLAECEHARWNAFFIVNNWKYGPKKDERTKTHDCLLTWAELKQLRPDTIIYDYQNVYHIPESLSYNFK